MISGVLGFTVALFLVFAFFLFAFILYYAKS